MTAYNCSNDRRKTLRLSSTFNERNYVQHIKVTTAVKARVENMVGIGDEWCPLAQPGR